MNKLIVFLMLTAFIFSSCKDESKDEMSKVVDEEQVSTIRMFNKDSSTINVSDKQLVTNWVESYFYTHKPITNQSVFNVSISKTTEIENTDIRTIGFSLYLPPVAPEKFFTSGIYPVDSVNIEFVTRNSIGFETKWENFQDAKALLKWETASYADKRFKGKGSITLSKKLTFKNGPHIYFPSQTITFNIE